MRGLFLQKGVWLPWGAMDREGLVSNGTNLPSEHQEQAASGARMGDGCSQQTHQSPHDWHFRQMRGSFLPTGM